MNIAESLYCSAVLARRDMLEKHNLLASENPLDISAILDGEDKFHDTDGNFCEVDWIVVRVVPEGNSLRPESHHAVRLYTQCKETKHGYFSYFLTDGPPFGHPMDDLMLLEFLRDEQRLGLLKALDKHREWAIKLGISKAENQV